MNDIDQTVAAFLTTALLAPETAWIVLAILPALAFAYFGLVSAVALAMALPVYFVFLSIYTAWRSRL